MLERDRAATALYRFFDADGSLLYVGITHNVEQRWASHARLQPWWLDVAEKTVQWHDTRPAAIAMEDQALEREKPRYDRSGRLRGAVQQGQQVDARLIAEVQRATDAIRTAIDDGTFPPWRLMPTIGELSDRFHVPLVAVSKALKILDKQIVRFGDRFAPGDLSEVQRQAGKHGGVYVLASRLFGVEDFSLAELAAATGYSMSTVDCHLRRLVRANLVQREGSGQGGEVLFRIVNRDPIA